MKHVDIKVVLTSVAILGICVLFLARIDARRLVQVKNKNLPKEISFSELAKPITPPVYLPTVSISQSSIPSPSVVATPKQSLDTSINLAVPFFAQAPDGNWDLPYQEACEEASAILVDAFFKSKNLTKDVMRDEIFRLVDWQQKRFGYYFHTTVYETATIMREFYGYKKVEIIDNPTHEIIASNVRAGRPVIAPFAGRLLGNPYYRGEGPIFHELVIKGITQNGDYITNDVGTRMGKNFVYDKNVLLNALHDVDAGGDTWNNDSPDENIKNGPKRILVVYPN